MEPAEQPGLCWIKASRSYSTGACVELAPVDDMIAVRDSKNPHVHLRLTRQEIRAFIDGAKNGEFDHLVGRES